MAKIEAIIINSAGDVKEHIYRERNVDETGEHAVRNYQRVIDPNNASTIEIFELIDDIPVEV